ncbi:MAG: exonuclease SbcCD subunit D [Anaerolineaceae bacterium]
MTTILHFADAHIDMANYGRHDPETGLPLRVLDFLKSLDTIVDTAVNEKVDLVIFAGDAYKDRTPAPTFQREWGKRIMRLSRAGIPTLLLVGNHDTSPANGRASSIQEFDTLSVPHVKVIGTPQMLGPQDLEGLPLQIIALPWIGRSALAARMSEANGDFNKVYTELEENLTDLVRNWLDDADPALPVVLTAHCSVQGAKYGGERSVMLGGDLVLSRSLVCDSRLAYTALGHIHKPQDLNENAQPPVIYPGSIERVDFGEVGDDKFFVIAHVEAGQPTRVEWRKLDGVRRFLDIYFRMEDGENLTERLLAKMPAPEMLADAVVRYTIDYPRDLEAQIDENALRSAAEGAFEFYLVKRPQADIRVRLPQDQSMSNLSPLDLLDVYWRAEHTNNGEAESLQKLAAEIIQPQGEEQA